MTVSLEAVSARQGSEWHIHPTSIDLKPGVFNVLLGPTLAGKTTLLRLIAGLDKPAGGRVLVNGEDVTGRSVRQRNIAMVYQQFINYPNLTVFENIASPLRIAGVAARERDQKVKDIAGLLRLSPMLQRRPSELSGGQQQRTAIARAIAKGSDLILFDEPLVNLDYKLREELREELPKLFSGEATVVYATAEPTEALLLGGYTATLSEGKITQYAPTTEVYRWPIDLQSAKTFSDPPLNIVEFTKQSESLQLASGERCSIPKHWSSLSDGPYIAGFRPHHVFHSAMSAPQSSQTLKVDGTVIVTEISGSESFIHTDIAGSDHVWVAQLHGVHRFEVGEAIQLCVDTGSFFVFDDKGNNVTPKNVSATSAM